MVTKTITERKITVKKSEFLTILNRVRWTISSSALIPILQSFCFKDDLVYGYNGQAGVATRCSLNGMNFAVPGALFYKIVSNLFDEITLSQTDKRINISSGGHSTWIGYTTTTGYPDIIPTNYTKLTDAKNLLSALRSIAFIVGTNVMRSELLGATIKGNYVYASEGQRIGRHKLDGFIADETNLPSEAIAQLSKLGQPDYLFSCRSGAGAMYSETKTLYITRSYENKFPCSTVDQLLSRTQEEYVAEVPDTFVAAINRVSILAQQQAEVEIIVEYKSDVKKLVVKASTPGIGSSVEEVDWDFKHPFKFAVAPTYILQGLTCSKKIDFTDVASPEAKNRAIKFLAGDFEHAAGLMLLKEG